MNRYHEYVTSDPSTSFVVNGPALGPGFAHDPASGSALYGSGVVVGFGNCRSVNPRFAGTADASTAIRSLPFCRKYAGNRPTLPVCFFVHCNPKELSSKTVGVTSSLIPPIGFSSCEYVTGPVTTLGKNVPAEVNAPFGALPPRRHASTAS